MESLLSLSFVLIVYSIGDYISQKTKSIVSMMFTASALFLVGFWLGVPETLFEDAQLMGIGSLLIGLLITHMGTLLNFEDLKVQWKTVLIGLSAVVGIGVFLFAVGTPILGREYAVAAAPPISGGVVAAIIMGEVATAKGFNDIAVFATILVVVQGFFGYPIASYFLNKEAKLILKRKNEFTQENLTTSNSKGQAVSRKKIIPPLPKELQTSFVLLAKLSLTALLSFKLAELTNNIIHPYVMCLLVGIVACEIGFLKRDILTQSNSSGLAMVGLMAVIFSSLAKATPDMILSLLFPIVASLTLGTIGIIIFSAIVGKLLCISPSMSIAIGSSALFGFPGTYIISNEVATANAKNEEEKQMILAEILPKMLVAGFITVTIASVILAGVMAKMF
ncbi:MAG: hypothetical protein GX069_09510 [Tissierellia bacterium]|nr:hypothetical protein [Tissierellia bacterium]